MLAGIFVVDSVAAIAEDSAPQSVACTPGEVTARRTRDSKTFQKADCSFTTEFGSLIHYQDESGQWKDVDLRFRPQVDGFVMDRHNLVVKALGANIEITERDSGEGIRWLTPVVPEVAGRNVSFANGGLLWTYSTRKSGLKLSAVVDEARGLRTYEFRYQLLGSAADLSVDEAGNLVSSSFMIPRATSLGANLELYEAGKWQLLPGQRVAFTFDDTELPAEAFPYELDPTTTFTANVATSADDGTVQGLSNSYPPSGGTNTDLTGPYITAQRTYQSWMNPPGYSTSVGVMRWNTAALPDGAVLTSADVLVNKWYSPIYDSTTYHQDNRNLTADWHETGGITTSSFSKDAQTNALARLPLWLLSNNVDYTIRLDNTGGVSKTGYTGLRWHVDGGQPTGMNHVYFSAYDDTTYSEPRLIVNYELASSPTISSVSDGPDPVSAGNSTTFTVGWSDPNAGDSVRGLICKTPAVTPTGLCADAGWSAGNYSTTSPSTFTYRTWPEDVGTNTYYAFACDVSGGCSSPVSGTFTVTNSPPSATSATDSPDPVVFGNAVNFSVTWSDPNSNDSVRAIVCKTNAVSGGSCPGGAWASGGSSSTSPATASYSTSSSDLGTHNYYAFVCDRSNACSGNVSGTFTVRAPNAAPTITSASDIPDPVAAGNVLNFSVGWSDSNPGDSVRGVICKTNAINSSASCPGGAWATGGLSSTSPAGASLTSSLADVGTHNYYAFACDQSNACSSSLSGTFTVVPPNAAPSIGSATDGPDPVTAGRPITFSVTWGDSNGDSAKVLICKTNAVSASSCPGGTWASSAFSSSSPTQVTYTTSSADAGARSYYAFVCDSLGACSSSAAGTFTVRIDGPPTITSANASPNPVTEGGVVTFTVGWNDPDDSVRAVVCRTNAIASGVCQGGGLASGGPSQASPSSATYSTRASDAGTMTYYAFACDSSNACSSGVAGSLTVNALPPPDAPDITQTPDDPTRAPTLTFAFQGQGGVSFECSLTGPSGTVSPYAPCTSPKGYSSSGLSPDLYVFHVRAVSNAGRRSQEADAEVAVHFGGNGQELEPSPYEDDADVAGERAEQYAGSRHGGSWTTYRQNQTIDVHVGVVGMTPLDELLVEAFSTDGVVINAERVKYAYADLQRFAETVSPVDKTRRYMVRIDVAANRLILYVEDAAGTESGTPAVDLGSDIPGDAVDARWVRSAALTPFSANTRSTFPTYKAGKRYGLKEGGKAECGVAFAMVLENGNKLGLTAGHCGDEEDEIFMGTNRGKRVGRIYRDGEHGQDVVVSDTALVTVADEHMTRNVHINPGFSRMVVKADRSIEKGDMVCLSGSISGIDCGHVLDMYPYAWAGFDYKWKNIWCADIDEAVRHDSGSPIYRPRGKPVHDQHGTTGEAVAIGVLVGGTYGEPNDIACFEAIGQAETQRGAVVWES